MCRSDAHLCACLFHRQILHQVDASYIVISPDTHCQLTTVYSVDFTGRRRMQQTFSGNNGNSRNLGALTFASYAGQPAASGDEPSCALVM